MPQPINGIILLDKSLHLTSNAALQSIKRLFNAKKAGHTGSLDPLATGMLPICFGEATKFSQFLLDANKTYVVTAKLGTETTTGDKEGEVTFTAVNPPYDLASLSTILQSFMGEIAQIPPMFSAIKHHGQPLYKLARKGIEVERKPRQVQIFSLTVEQVTTDEITLQVHCSKGTYIRTLIQDIGRKLGCGAHVSELRRTVVYPYHNMPMYSLENLKALASSEGTAALNQYLLPIETAVTIYPAIHLSAAATFYLRTGQSVRAGEAPHSNYIRLYSDSGQFLGVGSLLPDGRVKPERLMNLS